jgi:prophage regulatory protein
LARDKKQMEKKAGFARLPEVRSFAAAGTSTLYNWMAQDCFPKPVKLGASAVGWRWDDLYAWADSRKTAEYRAKAAA